MNLDVFAARGCRALCATLLALLCAAPVAAADDSPSADDDNDPTDGIYDPLEEFNRAMFAVHEGLDQMALRPAAKGYETVVPLPTRVAVGNFYDNLKEIGRGGNAVLQGKPKRGLSGLGRLLINSTVGIFGLFDVASELGLDESDEDFGQTLAVWGVPSGPYLFLPLVGPSSFRGTAGWALDRVTYPLWAQTDDHPRLRNGLSLLNMVHARSEYLDADQVLDDAAFDKYVYLRSAYLQRRAAQVQD